MNSSVTTEATATRRPRARRATRTIPSFQLRVRRVRVAEGQVPYAGDSVKTPEAVATMARSLIGDSAQEHFYVFFLDAKNRVIGCSEIARGGMDMCLVDPRILFRTAILAGAASLIVAHNHPSGDASPSREDQELTRRLRQGAQLLGIGLLDHVVVTADDFESFAEAGLFR